MRGNFRMALSGVRGSKWRSVLTMVGVIIGIVAVVTVVGIGEGVKKQIAGTLNRFGPGMVIIRPGQVSDAGTGIAHGNTDVLFGLNNASSLTIADMQTIQKAPGVSKVSPLGLIPGVPTADKHKDASAFVLSANANTAMLLNQRVEEGDFWSSEDENAQTAVIGHDVAQALFDEPVPLGRTFRFRGEDFIVRGIFAPFIKVPFSPTANFNDAIFIPYRTAARLTSNTAGLYVVLAQSQNPKQVDAVASAISSGLSAAHGGSQDFSVLTPSKSAAMNSDVVRLLSTWIFAIAAISLLIGGVGIMNIMLLNVTERMHEIGVRKAIGASSRQIMLQFMTEATVLSVVGGAIGIVLSLGVTGLLYTYSDLKPVISWHAVIIATLVSLGIGIVFGTAPAIKAARKDPIEALRHE